ncbi:MAG TPA: hypothetical protein VIY72_08875, partial [Acidimicrobiales bacterium]
SHAAPAASVGETTVSHYEDHDGCPRRAALIGARAIAHRGTVAYLRTHSPAEIQVRVAFAGIGDRGPHGALVYLLQADESECLHDDPIGAWPSHALTESFTARVIDGAVRFATHIGPAFGTARFTSGPVLLG